MHIAHATEALSDGGKVYCLRWYLQALLTEYSNETTVSRMEADLKTLKITMAEKHSTVQGLKIVMLPLPTDHFTGRDEYLRTIEASFDFPKTSAKLRRQRRFVLYGTGGMGKTQLALKFLDKHSDKYVR